MRRLTAYRAHLASWAEANRLRRSTREPCGHGVRGLDPFSRRHRDHHARLCEEVRRDLLDHGTLWARDGRPVVLLAHCFRPGRGEPGHDAYTERVARYAAAFGLGWWVGWAGGQCAFYGAGTTPVMFGAPGVDLDAFVMDLSPEAADRRERRRQAERQRLARRRAERRAAR